MEFDRAALLESVYEYYDLDFPHGAGNRKVKCPVHDETHPSASVDTSAGVFLCFACGARGSGIDLVMAREGLEYGDAVRFINEHVAPEGAEVRRGVRGQQSGGVRSRKGDQPSRRKYVPSWMRAST